MNLHDLLSVNNIAFTLFGYPMSWIELWGTVFNLASVWLVAVGNILTWPVGIVGVVLFAILFFQIQLYSDLFEQFYYFVTGFWGWWLWQKGGLKDEKVRVERISQTEIVVYSLLIIVGTLVMTVVVKNLNVWWQAIFALPASYPMLDAFTTVMSFAAQWLMAKKKIECWLLWIAVDVIGIGLYFVKGVVFVSLLYLVFLVLAIRGYQNWRKLYKTQNEKAL